MHRRQFLRNLFGVATTGVLIAGPVEYGLRTEATMRNFRVFQEGVLCRSGQMTVGGLKRVVHDYGIRTVISLRDAAVPGDPPPDLDEEECCKKIGIAHYRLRPAKWEAPKGPAPAEANVALFRKIMDDPANYPVLIHCFAGVHRTGAYCAIYRMEYQGWSNERAIEELKADGYINLNREQDILGYLDHYQPRWKAAGLDGPPPLATRFLGRKPPRSQED